MATKHKNLYLYLALTCFIGIILIFIFDGYMGIYDTLIVKVGEYPDQKIEADQWTQPYADFSTAVKWGGKAFFYYEVDNRFFSSYEAHVEVSVWHSLEKVSDILTQTVSLSSFGKNQIEWVVDTAGLIPANVTPEQGYEFTLLIKRGEIERRFIIFVRASEYTIKPIPAPSG
jgi:hypothetical protein